MRFIVPAGLPRHGSAAAAVALALGWLSGLGPGGSGSPDVPAARRAVPPVARRAVPSAASPRLRPAPLPSRPSRLRLPRSQPPFGPSRLPSGPLRPTAPGVDCRAVKCVALTFDDGPGIYTPKLLGMLAAHRVRATFFLIGRNIPGREATVRRELADGHAIGDHTWTHPQLSSLSEGAMRSELTRTLNEIRKVTGGTTGMMRPPYGATSPRVGAVCRSLGLAQIGWSVDTDDWRDRDSRIVAQRAISRARRDDIILMHDIHPTTVNAVPKILAGLAKRGFTFVTVPELLAGGPLNPGTSYFEGGAHQGRLRDIPDGRAAGDGAA